ncbi:hypothetical protein [Sulfitobacter sp.]|uniref:calcium-binding protein n=1 Tax=Sulfitobacter sp. TaxID=1903071 RepID=UPI003EF79DFA
MTGLIHRGTWFGEGFEGASPTLSIRMVQTSSGSFFEIDDFAELSTQRVSIQTNAAPVTVSMVRDITSARLPLVVEGQAGSLPANALANALVSGDGSAHLSNMGLGGFTGRAVNILATEVGGQDILYVARPDGLGVTRLRADDGILFGDRTFGARDSLYTDDISDMAVVDTGSSSYLFLGSAREHGITQFEIGAHGGLDNAQVLGREQSLPVQTVTALEAVEVAGQDYLIVAAAGSSSLSVLAVSPSGVLGVTDHLIDSMETRFQGVAQLETVTVEGHVFVLASGMDDGISLFRLTAEGRLVHQGSLADTTASGLDAVSALAAMAGRDGIDVLATSGAEAGLTQLHIAFDTSGIVGVGQQGSVSGSAGDDLLSLRDGNGSLSGGAGDDILSDGAGRNRMSGGSGADTFVLMADGERDVIEDLDIREDRIDLSAWGMLYSIDQLNIRSTSTGAVLEYAEEELELVNQAGRSLSAADLVRVLPEFLSHVDVTLGPLLVSEAQAAPVDTTPQPLITVRPSLVSPDIHTPSFLPDEITNWFPFDAPTPGSAPIPASTPGASPPQPAASRGVELKGGSGADLLEGTVRDDTIEGLGGNDSLRGGDGTDGLKGGNGNDWLWGGAGDDKLPGESGNDRIFGEDGNDRLGGGDGNDVMDGGRGNDTGGGGLGDDTIIGGDGDDWFSGGPGFDSMDGGGGNDRLAGSYSHDTVLGGTGSDTIGGGDGHDFIVGGSGNDEIGAGNHNDTVYGGGGNDFLGGGGGNDVLYGGNNQDTLNPGYGDDTLYGGKGADTFVFNARVAGGSAVIADFEDGTDLVRLVGLGLGGNPMSRIDISMDALGAERGAMIDYGPHQILLVGIDPDDLSRSDFLFV